MKTLLVDTTPKNARNQGSINLGFEIVKDVLCADHCHFSQIVTGEYDQIAFNIYYPTHIFNMINFLHRHKINPLKDQRRCGRQIIVGGQGVGINGILKNIADDISLGEIDLSENSDSIISHPVIKGRKGVVELTRGCKNKCKFCEYTHVWATRYREKDISLVKKQISWLVSRGVRFVNFLSANFAGYSNITELVLYAKSKGVTILNSDSCLKDIKNILPVIEYLPRYMKVGVESFTQEVRYGISKPISDDLLYSTIEQLMERLNGIHLYLIYGLPNENYSNWFHALGEIDKLRKFHTREIPNLFGGATRYNTKNIRVEFSITNFEPCIGTPLEATPEVNFEDKGKFITEWAESLIGNGFIKSKNFDYKTAKGRIGRKKLSYELLMKLKKCGSEVTDFLTAYKKPVGRSIKDNEAVEIMSSLTGEQT